MKMRAMLPAAVLILSSPGLTACGEKVRLALPPVELTTCADEPLAPELPGQDMQAARDALMLGYVLALRAAWGDCRAKVDGSKAWREAAD